MGGGFYSNKDVEMSKEGWVGVDFDGTLAYYDKWRGDLVFGKPIEPMVEKVKMAISKGYEVRIFTARISGLGELDKFTIISALHTWLKDAGLPTLVVTNVKDFQMVELWDDRAVQVDHNTGEFIGHSTRGIC